MFAVCYINTWDDQPGENETFVFADTLQGALALADLLVKVDNSVRVVRIEDRSYLSNKMCYYEKK